MNFLAHCFFSENNSQSVVGNLLGDFSKGLDESNLKPKIKEGLSKHRAIDKFTDGHTLVKQAKQCFSPSRRRFSGVAVDVLFDHYLIRHWQRFSNQSFISYKSKVYKLIEQGYPLMPVAMQQSMTSLVNNDWFESYGSLQGTGFAIDRIAQRIRFENQFAGCIDDIIQQDQHLEQLFLDFFPQLQQFASEY